MVSSHFIHIQQNDSDNTASLMDNLNACPRADSKVMRSQLMAFDNIVSRLNWDAKHIRSAIWEDDTVA